MPTGGFGLNTGLGDVVNLGWKLAAVVKRQAQSLLLDTYEQERRTVCLHNLKAAQKNADDMMTLRKKHNPADDPEGFAKANASVAKQHTHSLGATMGYAYSDSPLTLLRKPHSTKPMDNSVYVPTVAPGYFLPHSWIDGHQSIYNALSAIHWTLIISGAGDFALVQQWQEKFNQHQIPLDILKVQKNLYPFQYILIRPDWHIAFNGDGLNNDYFDNCINKFFS